jgi:hypothetical protein
VSGFAFSGDTGTSSINEIQALMKSSGVPYTVSSTYRSNGGTDWHGTHNAVDSYSSAANMDKLAAYLYQYSPYLLELIHTSGNGGGFYVKNGVRDYAYSAAIKQEHANHVHIAATLSGLRAASDGKLSIPAGSTGTRPGCLPAAATAFLVVAYPIGDILWKIIS